MFRLWCVLIGYALGLVSTAYIVGKVHGIDIREHGSGNAGTTNTLRVLGRRAGAIVLAGDVCKCLVAVFVCWLIFHKMEGYDSYKYLIRIYASAGTILGHNYPFYLKFHGGKGMACFVGMAIAFLYFPIYPGQIILFFAIFLLTHYVSLGSIFFGLGFFAQVVIFGTFGFFGLQPAELIELYAVVGALALLLIFQHRSNIVKLINHTEKKTYLGKRREKPELRQEEEERAAEEARKAAEAKEQEDEEDKAKDSEEEPVIGEEDKTLKLSEEDLEEIKKSTSKEEETK
jgi:glycerol-3-phosphate acyltransferase PlsY